MSMEIRNVNMGDYGAVSSLTQQVHDIHSGRRPDIFRTSGHPMPFHEYAKLFGHPDIFALVAADGGEVIALCVVEIRRIHNHPVMENRTVAYVEDLCVCESHRRRGVGRQLMQAAMERAREKGASCMELKVLSFNEEATRFYESLGMTTQCLQMEIKL